MKTLLSKIRMAPVACLAIFTLAMLPLVHANENEREKKGPMPVEIKYIGNVNGQMIFDLLFSSTEETRYMVIIRDQYGEVWYKDKMKGNIFSKRFSVKLNEAELKSFQFEITNSKTNRTTTYNVETISRIVQDVVINKR